MNGLLVAIGFLTRIPVPERVFGDGRARASSLCWYPAVGLLLGGLLCGMAWIVRAWPSMLAAAVVLATWVALTGALHLDGLADSADAWVGGMGDRDRTLAIMKDPRSGPAGVTALVLTLLLKFAALASMPPWPGLVVAPLLGRTALTAAFLAVPYVRSGGIGEALRGAPRAIGMGAVALGIAACLCLGARGVAACSAAVLVFAAWRGACLRRLGGMTGDTCGALAEITETAVLIAVAAA